MTHNIISDLDSALLAMAAIEDRTGDVWLKSQLDAVDLLEGYDLAYLAHDSNDGVQVWYTIGEALIELASVGVRPDDCDQESWDEIRDQIACIVYGAEGWNRWGVRYNGDVIFSRFHARTGDLDLAIQGGFETW